MEHKLIEAQWQQYRERVVHSNAPDVQVSECKLAFYGGASALLGSLKLLAATGVSDEEASKVINDMQDEIVAFAKEVRDGQHHR